MANLLDLMKPEDRERALESYRQRMAGQSSYKHSKVSPEAYLVAELGYYFGWPAIEAFKRGYVETFDEHTGKKSKIPVTMEEISAYVDAARKVWYAKVIDTARGSQVATASVLSDKKGKSVWERGMKPFYEGAKI